MESDDHDAYKKKVFDHWELLREVARKKFPAHNREQLSSLADEGLSYVLNKLEEDHWLRIREYRGQSSFERYLAQVAQRLLGDFTRQKFGRLRVPEKLKRLGPLWERAYKKLCWERLPVTAVIEDLRNTSDQKSDPIAFWEIVSAIRAKIIHCGALFTSQILQSESDFPDSIDVKKFMESAAQTPSIEDAATADQHARLLKVIADWLSPDRIAEPNHNPDDSPLAVTLQKFVESLQLTDEEQLLLRLVFHEGKEVAEAGQELGLNQNQTHGRLRRLLARIRSALESAGLAQALKGILKDDDNF